MNIIMRPIQNKKPTKSKNIFWSIMIILFAIQIILPLLMRYLWPIDSVYFYYTVVILISLFFLFRYTDLPPENCASCN